MDIRKWAASKRRLMWRRAQHAAAATRVAATNVQIAPRPTTMMPDTQTTMQPSQYTRTHTQTNTIYLEDSTPLR